MTTEPDVMRLFEQANPVPDTGGIAPMVSASGYLDTLERKSSTVTFTPIQPDAPEQQNSNTKRPWLMVASAVAALALVGALVFAGTGSDEDPVPADQPEPTVPADPVDQAEPVEEAEEPVSTATAETPAAVDDAGALAIGEALISAVNERDAAAAAALLADDATVDFLSARDKDDLPGLIEFFTVDDTNFDIESCQPGSSHPVTCTAEFSNELSRPLVGDPILGTFYFQIDNGEISSLALVLDRNFGEQVFDPWLTFIQEQHPDDFDKMILVDADVNVPLGPKLTEESSTLHLAYIAEYLAAITSEVGAS
jgi:hypothetical protein